MKKIMTFLVIILGLFMLSGCGKTDKDSLLKKMNNNLNNSKGYQLKAELELINNDDSYKYDVAVSYKKRDYYRISLMNKVNNHEQIILKNKEGVYVLSPVLNKSFKFQSNWPYNNSQSYLPQSVVNDLRSDAKVKMKKVKNGYVFVSKVNYKNNANLTHQEVLVDDDLNIKSVKVLDDDENPQIIVKYNTFDNNAKFKKNYFVLESNMKTIKSNNNSKKTSKLDDAIYPMYLPDNTYLDSEKVIDLTNGSRIILTFSGDNPFMLVEQVASKSSEFEVVPTSGDIDMSAFGTIIVDDSSVSWVNGDVEYYLVSSTLSQSELVKVANSISTIPVSK